MAMTLYHGEPNGPSLTVLAALFETGHEAELKFIDLAKGERHGAGVPRGVEVEMSIEGEGPVLVANGEPMADSVFIARFFNDTAKTSPIAPEDPFERWEMMTWCRQIIERTAPAAAYLGVKAALSQELAAMDAAAFDAMVAPIGSEDLKQRWIDARNGDFGEDKLSDSRAKINAAVEKIEAKLEHGKDWLLGAFSIADLETYAWVAGMRDIVPEAFEDKPRAAAWRARVKARPSVARALSLAKTPAPEKAWAPGPEINRWG